LERRLNVHHYARVSLGAVALPRFTPAVWASHALPAASFAGSGHAGLQARLDKASAKVAKYTAACKVANPAAKCSAVKARLTAKFNRWEARIEARIAKVTAQPNSAAKTAKLARLNHALSQIAALQAQL
jgi:hypothetical protein